MPDTVQMIILRPGEGPTLTDHPHDLGNLQWLVGGLVEAVPLPPGWQWEDSCTSYVNEEGKFEDLPPNNAATRWMLEHGGIFPGDYIAGTWVICGFDPRAGENRDLANEPALTLLHELALAMVA